MAKPVILALDDDADVLRAVERDLQREFSRDYRVMTAGSAEEGLTTVRRLILRDTPIALFLVDQRMPQVSGVEFLTEARQISPDSKRVLLTAYADTEAAIKAINVVDLDYYLLKPWDPPEQNLYPVLRDLLSAWSADYRPPFDGIRIIGHRLSAPSHETRQFLAGNQIPYRWLDIENDAEAQRLLDGMDNHTPELPLLIFSDGSVLEAPTNTQIANKVGMRTRPSTPFYDLIIIGGGPAGLAAAVYGASEGLKTVMIERSAPGGQAGTSSRIENYLGFPSGLSGADLARRGVTQARRFGVEMLTPQEVTGLRVDSTYRYVEASDCELSSHALLITTGVSYRRLPVSGLDRLEGAGVYYGSAMTEASNCAGQDVYIVGGANSAGQAAVYLAGPAHSITMLVRGPSLAAGMSQYLVEQIEAAPNITVEVCSSVVEALGTDSLEGLVIENANTGERRTVSAGSLFIFIGAEPYTDWVRTTLARDTYGFILCGPELIHDGKPPAGWPLTRDPYLLETSVPGVFVAGDVRSGSVKRVASAVGEGSMAVMFIHQYLASI